MVPGSGRSSSPLQLVWEPFSTPFCNQGQSERYFTVERRNPRPVRVIFCRPTGPGSSLSLPFCFHFCTMLFTRYRRKNQRGLFWFSLLLNLLIDPTSVVARATKSNPCPGARAIQASGPWLVGWCSRGVSPSSRHFWPGCPYHL